MQILPFCLTFRHMVASRPGRWSLGFSWAQSVIGKLVLSNGSAHFGSPSDLHAQHLIPLTEIKEVHKNTIYVSGEYTRESLKKVCD